ncbi:hypothetical protein NP493_385g02008 [Ridgeia piscesae]|uniref:Death domain-containing protein n=1 Tax=Ridgeia piscesae TaxID=27915 RepID=A0AAD9L358_RIDPI|nr:hypothetical protein NP493_385g02008 [Ridgeia piscesae]
MSRPGRSTIQPRVISSSMAVDVVLSSWTTSVSSPSSTRQRDRRRWQKESTPSSMPTTWPMQERCDLHLTVSTMRLPKSRLFKCIQARDSEAALVGSQPFIVYDNHNHITLSITDIAASWQLQDNVTKVIAFLKVWHNMQPNCSFVLQSTTPGVATEVSCSVTAEQESSDEGDAAHVVIVEDMNKFQESSRHLRQIQTTTRLSTIPHQLKMQLASLLDPPDHIRGHDWRHLASELGLDEKVPYLESKGNPTELLLMVWEMRNDSLSSLTTTMRDIEREDAATTIRSFQETTTVEMAETSPKLEEECVVPEDLKTELVLLLDPIDEVNGHDWRHLAALLELNNKIRFLQRKSSPTDVLLDHCEMKNISLPALAAMMRTMGREDAAVTIECYII